MDSKICILHDTFLYKGGGERLILMMAKSLKADIASGFFDPGSFDLRKEGFEGKMIAVSSPVFKKGLRHIKMKLAFLFRTRFLRDYETVIFSGDCISAVRNVPSNVRKIYYCHTPPRYIFDRREDYLKKIPWYLKPVYLAILSVFKWAYLRDLSKMDIILTNSTNTKNRIKAFTGLDAEIVYPPVDTGFFTRDDSIVKEHYLSFSRLAGIKRVDRIVEAFKNMPEKRLVFTYGVNDPEKERILASCQGYANIVPVQSPNDPDLKALVQKTIATIYIPIDEDFGMISVESQSCGVPVIGVRDGGLLETVIDGKTGTLIGAEADIAELSDAVRSLDASVSHSMSDACQENAERFSYASFSSQLRDIVQR